MRNASWGGILLTVAESRGKLPSGTFMAPTVAVMAYFGVVGLPLGEGTLMAGDA